MPRTSVKSKRWMRRAAPQVQWQEAKVMRDAAVALSRRAAIAAGPNVAQRGLLLSTGEFKSSDVVNTIQCNILSAVQLLNGIARGDEINERTGRECVMKSIQINGHCYVTGSGIDQVMRVLIVYDRQTNGTALTAAQVISAAGTANDVVTPRNLENRRRFKILYDRMFQLNASGEPGSSRVFKFYRRLNHPITFNSGDAGTVADITTGSLYAVVVGTAPAGVSAGTVLLYSRVRYQDK